MTRLETERLLKNLDTRTRAIEQKLPTLATKAELAAAVEPLATKAELAAAVEPLATRAEMHEAIRKAVEPLATRAELYAIVKEEGERSRRHMDIIAERLSDDIRLLAEGHGWVADRLADHETRITRLERGRHDR